MKERGQSLVELAITFTFLMYLISGVVEFGIIFFQYVQLRDATQEGALYGSICPNELDEIESRIRNASTSPLDLTDDSVSITISTVEDGEAIEVHSIYEHKIFMPFVPRLLGRQYITLDAEVIDTLLGGECS